MKKSSFLTLVFSFVPGCGHMYLGAMKKGTFLLSAFWAVIFVASWFDLGFLCFLLPVLWFYSFFDALNLRLCHYEYVKQMDNQFGRQFQSMVLGGWKPKVQGRHVAVGVTCIMLGIYLIFTKALWPYLDAFDLPGWVFSALRRIPTLLLAVVIIVLGIRLLRKKEIKAGEPADFTEYKGDHQNDAV